MSGYALQRIVVGGDGKPAIEPPGGSDGAQYVVSATQPDTTGWSAGDTWMDISSYSSTVAGVMRVWTGTTFFPTPVGTPGAGVTLGSDDFTGIDGAAWSTSKWGLGREATMGTGGGATLLSGTGQLAASNYGNFDGNSTTSRRYIMTDADDVHAFFRFKWDSTSGYFGTHIRHSGSVIDRKDGYWLNCSKPSNQWSLNVIDGSYNSSLLGTAQTIAWADNTWYYVRFKCQGTTIKGKVWLASASEPSTWAVQVTDSTYTAPGKFGFSMAGGATSTLPRRVFIDDLQLHDS